MVKDLRLMQLSDVLKDRNVTSGELNKVIGLYNSNNYNNEIEIQSIEGEPYVTRHDCFCLESFVQENLLTTDEFARKANVPTSLVETMIKVTQETGSFIPNDAQLRAYTMGGQYYIYAAWLDRFEARAERFDEFEKNREEYEKIAEEDLEFGLPGSAVANKEEEEQKAEEPEEIEDDFEDEDLEEDEEEDDKSDKKKKQAQKRKEEQDRLARENASIEARRRENNLADETRKENDRLADEMRKQNLSASEMANAQILAAQLQASLELANKNSDIRARAIELAAAEAAVETVKKQEDARKELERIAFEKKREEEFKKEEFLKDEASQKEQARLAHQEKVSNAMGSAYTNPDQPTQSTVQAATYDYSKAAEDALKAQIAEEQKLALQRATEAAIANDIAIKSREADAQRTRAAELAIEAERARKAAEASNDAAKAKHAAEMAAEAERARKALADAEALAEQARRTSAENAARMANAINIQNGTQGTADAFVVSNIAIQERVKEEERAYEQRMKELQEKKLAEDKLARQKKEEQDKAQQEKLLREKKLADEKLARQKKEEQEKSERDNAERERKAKEADTSHVGSGNLGNDSNGHDIYSRSGDSSHDSGGNIGGESGSAHHSGGLNFDNGEPQKKYESEQPKTPPAQDAIQQDPPREPSGDIHRGDVGHIYHGGGANLGGGEPQKEYKAHEQEQPKGSPVVENTRKDPEPGFQPKEPEVVTNPAPVSQTHVGGENFAGSGSGAEHHSGSTNFGNGEGSKSFAEPTTKVDTVIGVIKAVTDEVTPKPQEQVVQKSPNDVGAVSHSGGANYEDGDQSKIRVIHDQTQVGHDNAGNNDLGVGHHFVGNNLDNGNNHEGSDGTGAGAGSAYHGGGINLGGGEPQKDPEPGFQPKEPETVVKPAPVSQTHVGGENLAGSGSGAEHYGSDTNYGTKDEDKGFVAPATKTDTTQGVVKAIMDEGVTKPATDTTTVTQNSYTRESEAPRIETATVQTISGNHYVVPESQRERFEQLKAAVESPGSTPAEIKKELKRYERYNPQAMEQVGEAIAPTAKQTEQTQPAPRTAESKVGENNYAAINVVGNNDSGINKAIASAEKNRPTAGVVTTTTEGAMTDAARASNDKKGSDSKPEKVDVSKVVLITVDGKSVMQASIEYQNSIKEAIKQGTTGVRGATCEDEVIRAAIASGIVIDESLKAKNEFFVTENRLNAAAVARDIVMMELRHDARDDAALAVGGEGKLADKIAQRGNLDALDDDRFNADGTQRVKPQNSINGATLAGTSSGTVPQQVGNATNNVAVNGQNKNNLQQIANMVAVSGIVGQITVNDYANGRLGNEIGKAMRDRFEENAKTSVTNRHIQTELDKQSTVDKTLGNMQGTHSEQKLPMGAHGTEKTTANPNNPTAGKVPGKVNGESISDIHNSGNIQDRGPDDKVASAAERPEGMLQLSQSYVRADWGKLVDSFAGRAQGDIERAMRQSQTFRGYMTIIDGARTVTEVANGLTLGVFSNSLSQANAADYITKGAKGTFLLKGQAKNASYVALSAQIRHAQFNMVEMNKILKKEAERAEVAKKNGEKGTFFVKEDGSAFQLDASLGLIVKKGKGKKISDKDRVASDKMLDEFLEKNGFTLGDLESIKNGTAGNAGVDLAVLITQMKGDKNSAKLMAALQEKTGIQGLDTKFANIRKTRNGFTTKELLDADKTLSNYLNMKLGIKMDGLTAKQLRDMAAQCTDEEARMGLLTLAGIREAQQGMFRAGLLAGAKSIIRFVRSNTGNNETFAGVNKMYESVRTIAKIIRTPRKATKIVRFLLESRGDAINKKINKIRNKLEKGKFGKKRTQRLERRQNKLMGKTNKIDGKIAKTKKFEEKLDKLNPVKGIKKKWDNSSAGKWFKKVNAKRLEGLAKFKAKLANNRVFQVISAPFKGLEFILKLIKKILDVIKAIIKYIIIAVAILVLAILVSNLALYLVGTLGNSIAELFGQQDFTEERAGKSLIALQKFDKDFFAAEDAVMKKLQSTNLQEVMRENTNWFVRIFTTEENVYGFITPTNGTGKKDRYKLEYSGLPYNSEDGNQFQQVYYDGWYAETKDDEVPIVNIITRYSNAKDILCVVNTVYGGQINKYWDAVSGAFAGGTKEYSKQLWANTHFCGECFANIVPNEDDAGAICIHTSPLYACEKGYCWGSAKPQNTYKYYCNYKNTEATNDQKQTHWLYNNAGSGTGATYHGLWDGEAKIEATALNSGSTQKNVNRYLCVVGVSTYGTTGALAGEDKPVVYGTAPTDVGYNNPYTLWGKKVQSGDPRDTFKNESYVWPIDAIGAITSPFGGRILTEKVEMHNGVDFSAARGTKVFAVAGGEVIDVVWKCQNDVPKDLSGPSPCTSCYEVDRNGNYVLDRNGNKQLIGNHASGNYVKIKHSDGSVTTYVHLAEPTSMNPYTRTIQIGDTVTQGQPIGTVGNTGRSSGAHLHFSLNTEGGSNIDPMILFGGYSYGYTSPGSGSGNGAGCVRNFCERQTDVTKQQVTYQGENFKKATNGADIGYYKWKQTWNGNKDCTALPDEIEYCTNNNSDTEIADCNNQYTVKHSNSKIGSCQNKTSYYECDGYKSYCYGNDSCNNQDSEGDCKGHWSYCTWFAQDSKPCRYSTYNSRTGKYTCDGDHTRYCYSGERTYSACSHSVKTRSVCNGHRICGGHKQCEGHYICNGHNLAYCTGHTNLYTKTVIVGLNEYEGENYETDIMYNALIAKYKSTDTDILARWTTKNLDMQHGSMFSMSDPKIRRNIRKTYMEDWADRYNISFYQENTPFKMTQTEIQSVIQQQDSISHRTVVELALASVGRVGYHDKYSSKSEVTFTKIDNSLTEDDFYAQYDQFAQDIVQEHGSDSGGRIMSGLNNDTFVGFILWSAGEKSTFIRTKTGVTSGMSPIRAFTSDANVIDRITEISPGDIVTFNYPDASGAMTSRIGIVVTVNTNQSNDQKTLSYGSIGIVSCISEQSDAVYLIFTPQMVYNNGCKIYKY